MAIVGPFNIVQNVVYSFLYFSFATQLIYSSKPTHLDWPGNVSLEFLSMILSWS